MFYCDKLVLRHKNRIMKKIDEIAESVGNRKRTQARKKFLMVGPKTTAVVGFRGDLLCDIREQGYEVVVAVPEDTCVQFFKDNNIGVRLTGLKKNAISVFNSIAYYRNLKKIMREEKPDIVMSFTIKPVIFGSMAAKKAGVENIYSLICGLGLLFSSNRVDIRVLRFVGGLLYRRVLKYNKKVIFQNRDDIEEFVKRKYVKRTQCELVDGSGVNLKKFHRNEIPKGPVSFIMVSRILREKGVMEYFEAAKIVKEKYPESKFVYVGAIDKNKNAINLATLKPYIEAKIVDYIPETNEVEKYVAKCSVFVLPSYYREGIPRTLLEATAMGRPILTTNTPGCRETVVEGKNGFFVEPRSSSDLAKKMIWMIQNRSELQKMGDVSYAFCLKKFTINKVNDDMMRIMNIGEPNG